MRRLFVAVALVLSLSACSTVQSVENAWGTLTGSRVSPQAVYVARNAADAEIVTATNYLQLCHKNPTNRICSKTAEVEVAKATRSVRSARNAVRDFLRAHPDALGAQGVYDALVSATGALKQVLQTYGVIQ